MALPDLTTPASNPTQDLTTPASNLTQEPITPSSLEHIIARTIESYMSRLLIIQASHPSSSHSDPPPAYPPAPAVTSSAPAAPGSAAHHINLTSTPSILDPFVNVVTSPPPLPPILRTDLSEKIDFPKSADFVNFLDWRDDFISVVCSSYLNPLYDHDTKDLIIGIRPQDDPILFKTYNEKLYAKIALSLPQQNSF